ncbi:HlyD family efflux transporter periplasmic adaptor subunit [Bowmanella sp. Y26]|uniref:efflux RND transporter periplasmic adaptor subunit n=1 Tax=Bowmanella yangjiangensis TaxID=2811230 RepID=UPI001BDD0578|nr:HlyD family efflux transporter periplasmic adaptor subunit [Bowmanella yangjiangensis]MBT1062457.1 HlyD family efflux transporter periplasmic adaptor subunit [Bowmanella yangjiangensis]
MTTKRGSRHWLSWAALLVVALLLATAFWPQAVPVDMGKVSREALRITINEEGRTRVHDAYAVSAPVTGRLLRVEAEPGDKVEADKTVIAHILPLDPALLDIRTLEQARAAVDAANAALRMSKADLNKAFADEQLARSEQLRLQELLASGGVSQSAYDVGVRQLRAASASLDTAKAAVSLREAELANARARLVGFDGGQSGTSLPLAEHASPFAIKAPIDGQVLQLLQKSETIVSAGTPIMEIGDIGNDLEVIVELLSTDAVKVEPGNQVIIDSWGGPQQLEGEVVRVEPWGYTKYSALGVEEQRVLALIRFTGPSEPRQKLGHGYRVEVKIVLWQQQDALSLPSSALFRQGEQWMVFKVVKDKARLVPVTVGYNNGTRAQLISGLNQDDVVILYPGPELVDGMKVQPRVN